MIIVNADWLCSDWLCRGKIYLGNSGIIRDSRTSGVADFERIDDKRFALDCSEGLLTATLVDFQHLEWEPRGQAWQGPFGLGCICTLIAQNMIMHIMLIYIYIFIHIHNMLCIVLFCPCLGRLQAVVPSPWTRSMWKGRICTGSDSRAFQNPQNLPPLKQVWRFDIFDTLHPSMVVHCCIAGCKKLLLQ